MGVELRDEPSLLPVEDSLDELTRLADTAGIDVVGQAIQRINNPNSATYIGSGKVQEVKLLVDELQADVVIFDEQQVDGSARDLRRVQDLRHCNSSRR